MIDPAFVQGASTSAVSSAVSPHGQHLCPQVCLTLYGLGFAERIF
jgi:hypothetical protein